MARILIPSLISPHLIDYIENLLQRSSLDAFLCYSKYANPIYKQHIEGILITVEKLATASWDLLPIQYLEDYDVTILSFSWNLDVTSRSVTQNKNKESKFSLSNINKFVSALLDLSWNRLSRIEPNL